ncbi:hypothetical protein GcC1_066011 [Golovinomyces cichoracearum]|uniref:Uncharacterized protein n=1 Tax=Golovinomyces cichoracearum TaxID=62708 RepID=A0A420IRC1_9PEZI|nr:hypothetical protein GcC1_066011 [Golovinomyces cichoracearum]
MVVRLNIKLRLQEALLNRDAFKILCHYFWRYVTNMDTAMKSQQIKAPLKFLPKSLTLTNISEIITKDQAFGLINTLIKVKNESQEQVSH